MNHPIVESSDAVTLIAGGPVTAQDLRIALRLAPYLVAADSGADRALALGVEPRAVIGDFDSISQAAQMRLDPARLFPIREQETTDFAKALRDIEAPLVIALGALGGRVDHELAVLNALISIPQPCILLGKQDVVFAAPPQISLRLRIGDRLSLFPLAAVQGRSTGLRWPLEGISFAPNGAIGTSNEVAEPQVTLAFDAPGMLVILPRNRLDAAITALSPP